jgi:hypothetical protein
MINSIAYAFRMMGSLIFNKRGFATMKCRFTHINNSYLKSFPTELAAIYHILYTISLREKHEIGEVLERNRDKVESLLGKEEMNYEQKYYEAGSIFYKQIAKLYSEHPLYSSVDLNPDSGNQTLRSTQNFAQLPNVNSTQNTQNPATAQQTRKDSNLSKQALKNAKTNAGDKANVALEHQLDLVDVDDIIQDLHLTEK